MSTKNRVNIVGQSLPRGLTISQGMERARVPRYPKHTFNIRQRPYEITPFFIAPVLSGETMRNLLLQARCVSTPLKNRLIGHHLEHYFFYVKLRDLSDSDDLVSMLMDTTGDSDAAVNKAAADQPLFYTKQGAPEYMKMCLDSITEHYFRDEGETPDNYVGVVTGLPMAQWTNYKSMIESFIDNADLPTGEVTDTNPYPDHEKEYASWQFMRQMQLTEISFEDYLGTFGVRMQDEELKRPELVRMIKNWTYPTNTVDGAGDINTQASWSIQERADKDRFFKEPGFLIGVSVARPKVYMVQQDQTSASMLGDAFSWLPAMMKDTPLTSLKNVLGNSPETTLVSAATPADGELSDAGSYWYDVRDLYIYGDQFVNMAQTAADNNAVRAADLTDFHGKKYPLSADLQTLGAGDTLTYETDGIVSLNVMGTQIDMT